MVVKVQFYLHFKFLQKKNNIRKHNSNFVDRQQKTISSMSGEKRAPFSAARKQPK